jgi:DNA-binding NtrC family response regulator
MAHILIVDDEEKIRTILSIILSGAGHRVSEAGDGQQALQRLEDEHFELVISDVRMERMGGLDLLGAIGDRELGIPLIFITAYATLESAVEALRLGAADYLVKPFEEQDVILAVERALGMRRLLSENIRLKQQFNASGQQDDGVFASEAMRQVRNLAVKVSTADATVLLTGESGTGKEVVARFIHQAGPRKNEPFVALNCGAMAPSLVEAELFGHEKGAFTGADRQRAGKFEFAGSGTLFLDEVGELPLDVQVKLLRAIQEKTVQRVGANREIPVACRLVCATNRKLSRQVEQGRFREDLYYRLAVFPIELPPLRERKADLLPLVRHCIQKLGGRCPEGQHPLTPAAMALLQRHPWPGNVRELFNAVERAMILRGGALPLTADDFAQLAPPSPSTGGEGELFRLPASGIDYDALQRSIVCQSLEMTQGNQSAARLLGVSRARFRTLLGLLQEGGNRIVIHVRRNS